jgi:glutathione peroxidase-family protein
MVRRSPNSLLAQDLNLSISGFTPQYKGLQKLHEDYKDRGLVVIGFPCDQFGGQEPGNDEEIMQVRTTLHCQAVADTLLLRPVN